MALIQFTRTKGPAGILSCHYCINQKGRRLMRSRCEDLVGIRHLARNYKDVERYLGQYTFEDFLNFCLVYSKYILQEDVLPATLQQMWDQLCTAVEHYLTYPAAGEFSTRSRNAAADALLAYATRVEVTPEFQHLLTPNLHMLL